MGYYEDQRFGGGFKDHEEASEGLYGKGQARRDAGIEYLIDQIEAQGGLNYTSQTIQNLRNNVTLGNKGGRVGEDRNSLNWAIANAHRQAPDTPFMFSFNNVPGLETPVRFGGVAPKDQAANTITDRLVLPIPPETFSVQSANSQEEITSVLGLTYTHAGPVGLAEMSLEGIFPADGDASYIPEYVRTYGSYSPAVMCQKFVTAMNAGQPIEFTIADPSNQKIIMNTKVVTIVSFEWEVRAGHGQDRFYTMSLREWIPQTIYFGGYQPGASKKIKVTPIARSLFTIADKSFVPNKNRKQDRNRWREIYTMNKFVIDRYIKNVRTGKWNPDTGKPWAKNISRATRIAKINAFKRKNKKISGTLLLPLGMVLNVPTGAKLVLADK